MGMNFSPKSPWNGIYRIICVLALVSMGALASVPATALGSSPLPTILFADVTTPAIGSTTGNYMSQAICDYNKDGKLDLFCSSYDQVSRLFVNDSTSETMHFIDNAPAAGLAFASLGYDASADFWDPNNDGNMDVYVCSSSSKSMKNQGDGTYTDVTANSGLGMGWIINSVTPFDFDSDGKMDLYVEQGGWDRAGVDVLFKNNGDGSFSNVTASSGLGLSTAGGGALVGDYDLDGLPEIYVVTNGTNILYHRSGNGTFQELKGTGANSSGIGSGAVAGDYDNDGDLDILVTYNGPQRLFRNEIIPSGKLTFTDVTIAAGLTMPQHDGADATFGDVDNDGDLDLYVVCYKGFGEQLDHFYRNNGNGTFTDLTDSAALSDASRPDDSKCELADFNNDGKLDLVLTGLDSSIRQNVSTNAGHYLSVDVVGTTCNRDAVGARVTLAAGTSHQYREKQIGKPRGSQYSPRLHFGLADYTGPVDLSVKWPGGHGEAFHVNHVDQHLTLVQGQGFVAPTNVAPIDEETDVSVTPDLRASPFADPAGTHSASQWQVRSVDSPKDFSVRVFDSGPSSVSLTSITLPPGALEFYAGYFWRVRYKSSTGAWSDWSDETEFTTTYLGSTTPVNLSPDDNAVNVPVASSLEASPYYSSTPSVLHHASQWQVRPENSPADYSKVAFDSGLTTTDLTSTIVPSMVLSYGEIYRWRARYKGSNGVWTPWSRETAFVTETGGFANFNYLPLGGHIQDVLLDESRGRFWVLRNETSRVEAYELGTGNLIASIATGLQPESFAMTYDQRYLGVGSRGNIYLTVVDLAANPPAKIGFYNSVDLQKVFRVTPIGTSDFLFITRPDIFGSPPQGGHFNFWSGTTRQVTMSDWPCAAESFVLGLPPTNRWIVSAWGYSQGGVEMMEYQTGGTVTQLDEHMTGTFHSGSTMHGMDPVNKQLVMEDDLLSIEGDSFVYRGPVPYRYPDTEVLFNPADENQAIMSPKDSEFLWVWDLSILQPDFALDFASGMKWQGKGCFSRNGTVVLAVVTDVSHTNGVAVFSPPQGNPYTISSPAHGATDVSLIPTIRVSSPFPLTTNHIASQWQIRLASSPADYTSPVYDSGMTGAARTSFSVPAGLLRLGAAYSVRMRFRNNQGLVSPWCPESRFTTAKAAVSEEYVLYEANGDIRMVRTDGSQRVSLTSGPDHDSCPRFNSDATRIAFCSDREGQYRIWTMLIDGSDLRVIDGFQSSNPVELAWSPDGRQFVVSAQGNTFWIVNADGSGSKTLATYSDGRASQVDWSRSGKIALAVASLTKPGQVAVHTILPTGSGDTVILTSGTAPVWDGSGSNLLFARNNDLWRCSSTGGGTTNLTRTTSESETVAAWSPNSTKVFYASNHIPRSGTCLIRTANSDGSSAQTVYTENSEVKSLDSALVQIGLSHPPDQPQNVSPSNGATKVTIAPVLKSSVFHDSDPGDVHVWTQWQLRQAQGSYDDALVDKTSRTDLTSCALTAGILVPGQTYAWRVRYFDSYGNASSWSPETTFGTIPATAPEDKVLIIAGGGSFAGNSIAEQTKYLSGYAYRLSINRQVQDNHIKFLSAFPLIDADGNGTNDVDAAASRANLWSVLDPVNGWCATTNKLIVYVVDHGSKDSSNTYFKIKEDETVSAGEMDGLLDALQSAHPNMTVALICDFCYSGGFLETCQPVIGQRRICVSGSTRDSLAIFSPYIGGVSFSNFLFDSLSGGADLKMAFDVAQEGILAAYVGPPSYPLQTPWLEDDGISPISSKDDGFLARNFYWGSTAAYGATPPVIVAVTPDQTVTKRVPVTLWAELASGSTVDRVWVQVVRPDTKIPVAGPVTNLEEITLVRQGTSQTWSATLPTMSSAGEYRFTFFSRGKDAPGSTPMTSNPRLTRIQFQAPLAAEGAWAAYR